MAIFVEYGLTEWESLATATINAGDMLDYNFGIEPGGLGNILVLSASPIENIWNTTKIEKVIHHGREINLNTYR
jgi:imidazolonepropionase-like amidohydrolase